MNFTVKRIIKGMWFKNKKEGHGILKKYDGSKYEGMFNDNKQHGKIFIRGKGKLLFNDGTIIEGEWENGVLKE
jgi:hypothetical protein